MATTFDKPTLAQRILPLFQGFDGWLMGVVLLLAGAGLLAMYSSGYDHDQTGASRRDRERSHQPQQ